MVVVVNRDMFLRGWLEAHVTMLRWLASGPSAGYLRTSSGLLDVVDII